MIKLWEYRDKSWGIAFSRISKAFHDYSPDWVSWVDNVNDCDLALVHVVGIKEISVTNQVLEHGKKLVTVAHTYKTAGDIDWESLLTNSLLTISFHDFKEYYPNLSFSFFSSNWGCDENQFYRLAIRKTRKVFTTGHISETECIDKLFLASKNTNQVMYHTGTNFGWDNKFYKFLPFLGDRDFNILLNSTEYVSCLREKEGFEMAGIEGLFCSSRPIVPNLPTYRWYKDHGIFIDMKKDIVKQLEIILNTVPKEPNSNEMKEIHSKFSWSVIIKNIFDQLK
jgi:hypothetical protein